MIFQPLFPFRLSSLPTGADNYNPIGTSLSIQV